MQEEYSVSVVIPTRNRFSAVWGAIKSVIDQGQYIRQIIIVDDDSTDLTSDSYELLKSFDPRVEIYRSPYRIGGAAARNLGAERATGEFIAFLDDDDIWLEGKIAKQLIFLRKHRSCGAVLCSELCLSMQTGDVSWTNPRRVNRRRLIAHFPCPGTSCLMVRSTVFKLVGGFNPSLRRLQDWDLYLRLSAITELGLIREPLTLWSSHRGEQISKLDHALYSSYVKIFFKMKACLTAPELAYFRLLLLRHRRGGDIGFVQLLYLKIKMRFYKTICGW